MAATKIWVAATGSLIANGVFWFTLSLGANKVVVPPSPPVLTFERVTIDKNDRIKPKKVVMKVRPKPKPPEPKKLEPHVKPTPPPPSHNRVITAKALPAQNPPAILRPCPEETSSSAFRRTSKNRGTEWPQLPSLRRRSSRRRLLRLPSRSRSSLRLSRLLRP